MCALRSASRRDRDPRDPRRFPRVDMARQQRGRLLRAPAPPSAEAPPHGSDEGGQGVVEPRYARAPRFRRAPGRALDAPRARPRQGDALHLHHEKWDGRGYPARPQGPDVPLMARIIAVADTYDAMTSDRAYRRALPQRVAVTEIQRCSGTQFDPEVSHSFCEGARTRTARAKRARATRSRSSGRYLRGPRWRAPSRRPCRRSYPRASACSPASS